MHMLFESQIAITVPIVILYTCITYVLYHAPVWDTPAQFYWCSCCSSADLRQKVRVYSDAMYHIRELSYTHEAALPLCFSRRSITRAWHSRFQPLFRGGESATRCHHRLFHATRSFDNVGHFQGSFVFIDKTTLVLRIFQINFMGSSKC